MQNNETERYAPLLALIPKGKENGISRYELGKRLGLSVRAVSDLILSARRDHLIIASGNYGYYIPGNLAEAYEYYNVSRKRAVTILDSLKDVRKELKQAGYDLKKGGMQA